MNSTEILYLVLGALLGMMTGAVLLVVVIFPMLDRILEYRRRRFIRKMDKELRKHYEQRQD